FMKREFGKKLIEDFLVRQDLRLVVDVSGVYLPGHGTPTVILVGRSRSPIGPVVRAVLGARSEQERPDDPAKGLVWVSITEHIDTNGWEDNWITVTDLDRTLLATHPWNLKGGGTVALMNAIGQSKHATLSQHIVGKIGPASFPGVDDVFFAPQA